MKRTVEILVDIADVYDALNKWLSEEDANKLGWQIQKLNTICIARETKEEEE